MTSRTKYGLPRALSNKSRRGSGMTLLEVVLVIALLSLLAGGLFLGLVDTGSQERFDEGVERFESLLRMARSQAAINGRCIRLALEQNGRTTILCEDDPVSSPGVFTQLAASWSDMSPEGLVLVVPPAQEDVVSPEQGGLLITFRPDGSSDSVEATLAPVESEDTRRMVVRLNGDTGRISRHEFIQD